MERGHLRIHIGAATGVGTTFAMLDEGMRRAERGADLVVVGGAARGRPNTVRLLDALCRIARALPSVDVDEILRLAPDVVLVDELAQRDGGVPRWQHVDALLDAGIDVVATMNVQQVESLADPVWRILGAAPDDTVPDELLSRAEQIELVDVTPEAMRRRIAHGNVFTGTDGGTGADEADGVDLAAADLFAGPAFAELRALLMFWLADRLTAGVDDPREARERVVVAVTAAPGSDVVIRRAARLAQRSRATLLAVHVRRPGAEPHEALRQRRTLVHAMGGSYHELEGADVASTLVEFARIERATQLVVGTSGDRRAARRRRSLVDAVIRLAGRTDVHVVAHRSDGGAPGPPRPGGPRLAALASTWGRTLVIRWVATAATVIALAAVLAAARPHVSVSTALSLSLLVVVAIAAVAGRGPAVAAAIAAPLVTNWLLIPPYHTLRVGDVEHAVSLAVFVSVALIVSRFVSISTRRSAEAARLRDEATTLAALAGSRGPDPLASITAQLLDSFGLEGVSVLRVDGARTAVAASSGDRPPTSIREATFQEVVAPGVVLAGRGRTLTVDDHRVLRSFVQQLSKALEQHRLAALAAQAESLDRADELRTSMLRAVSHDLRTPLAGIKAAVSSLRQRDVVWPEGVPEAFLADIEDDADRLTDIVTNLLDLSRLQAGALRPAAGEVAPDEVVSAALRSLGQRADGVRFEVAADLVTVTADAALLERVIANLVSNALTWSPGEVSVRIHDRCDTVQIHVVDRGPGIHPRDRATVLQPFHRLDDSTSNEGLGLGLAIASGMTGAMGGSLELRDTPGGGLTVVVSLPPGAR